MPAEGSVLYDSDEKLSQMLSRSALVASGLHALMPRSGAGTRSSLDRKLPARKSSARTIARIGVLKASVFVNAQYLFHASR